MKFRPRKETFSEWGAVFIAIVLTAVLIALIGGMMSMRYTEKRRIEKSRQFWERPDRDYSAFEDLQRKAEEFDSETEEITEIVE